MCSIAGATTAQEVEQMLEIQIHRAPDGNHTVETPKFTMGNGRLSIIDLHSDNLICRQEGNLILSFNGEIYNYRDLRQDLEYRGWEFQTQSDTEVLLKSYKQWGVDCLKKFNGMFAFAILDASNNQLFLARDIAGQKPLYYRLDDFAFASEAKALKGTLRDDRFFNEFQHTFINTLYEGVYQLEPAHYMIYDLNTKECKTRPYWEFEPRPVNESTALEELQSLLEDAVRLTQQSDVPYTLYFSGGVDSSLIKYFGDFEETITFDREEMPKEYFENVIKDVVYHLDFPVGSLSSVPLYNMAHSAKLSDHKVVISGEGADEVFGGYIRYLPVAQRYFAAQRYPSYKEMFGMGEKQLDLISEYSRLSERNLTHNYMYELFSELFSKYDPITAMQMFDFKYILPSLLQMGDRMAAAFGLENRCPFLDKRLIEFGLSLPPHLKINDMDTKFLLRSLLRSKDLPEEKEKHGLTIPYGKWVNKTQNVRGLYFERIKEEWKNLQV